MNDITRYKKVVGLAQSNEPIKNVKKLETLILDLCTFQLKINAVIAWSLGKLLTELKAQTGHGKFLKFLENEKFPYSDRTAQKYMLLYQCHKSGADELKGKGITEALREAGILGLKKENILTYGHHKNNDVPEEWREEPWEYAFKVPPLNNKVELKYYRFEQLNSHELYLIRRDFSYPVKIAEVLAPGSEDTRLKHAHQGMMENIQRDIELYFMEVERIEVLNKKEKR